MEAVRNVDVWPLRRKRAFLVNKGFLISEDKTTGRTSLFRGDFINGKVGDFESLTAAVAHFSR